MENGAEEPEHSDTSAVIAKSAVVEDAISAKTLEADEVNAPVENAFSEKGLQSDEGGAKLVEDDTIKEVTETGHSPPTPDTEGDSGSAGQILEDHSAAVAAGSGDASTTRSETSPDSANEVKEPENETKTSLEVHSVSTETQPPEVSVIAADTETEPKDVSKETGALVTTDSSDSSSTVEEVSYDEKTGDDTQISKTVAAIESEGSVEVPPITGEELSGKNEELSEENLAISDVSSTPESAETTVVEDKHVELPATNDELIKKGSVADAVHTTDDDKGAEPPTADEEHQESSATSDSASPLAVEYNHVDTPSPVAAVEGSNIVDKDGKPATVEVESSSENVADEETQFNPVSTEAAFVAQDDAFSTAQAAAVEDDGAPSSDAVGVTKEVEAVTSGSQLADEEEKDVDVTSEELTKDEAPAEKLPVEANQDLESSEPDEGTAPNDLPSAQESVEETPVEIAATANLDEGSSETTPMEDSKIVEPGGPDSEAVQSAEAIPVVEDEVVELHTSQEDLSEESAAAEDSASTPESAAATPVADPKDVVSETSISPESAKANPVVEDRGVDVPTLHAELPKEETRRESPEIIPNDNATDVEPLTADERLHEEESGVDENPQTSSVEVIPAVESKDDEASVPPEEPTQEGTAVDGSGHAPESAEDAKEAEPERGVKELKQDDSLAAETISLTEPAEAIPVVEDRDVEGTTTPGIKIDEDTPDESTTATDEVTAFGDSSAVTPADDSGEGGVWPLSSQDGLDKAEILEDEIPSSEEATSTVDEKAVEAPKSHDELAREDNSDDVAHSHESAAEEIPLTKTSEDDIPGADVIDVDAATPLEEPPKEETTAGAQSLKTSEAPLVHDSEDAEPVTSDEVLKEEESNADGIPLTADIAEAAAPGVEGEDLEGPSDVGVPTPHEELSRDVSLTEDLIPGPESRETTSVEAPEDEGPVGADDIDSTPAVEDTGAEAPTTQEEHVSCDEVVPKDIDSSPAVEEASTPQEEFPEEVETAQKAALCAESEPATLGLDSKDGELAEVDEGATKGESVTDAIPSATHSADAISPAQGEDVEAPMAYEELSKDQTAEEVAHHPKSVADDIPLAAASDDAIPGAEDRGLEAPTSLAGLAMDETAPDDASLVSDSSQGTSILDDDIVDPPAHREELSNLETTNVPQAAQSVEAVGIKDASEVEPTTLDADVNQVDVTRDPIGGADEEAPTRNEGLAKEDTTDEASQSVEPAGANFPGDAEVAKPSIGEKELKEESIENETQATTTSDDVIPAVEVRDIHVSTPLEEPAKEETTDEVPQSQDSTADEILQVTVPEDTIPAADGKDLDFSASSEEVVKGETTDEVVQPQELADERPPTTAAESVVSTHVDKDVDILPPHAEASEGEGTDGVAQSQEPVTDDMQQSKASEVAVADVEDKDVDVSTLHEDLAKEEATDRGAELKESVADELPSTDVHVFTSLEEPIKDLNADEGAEPQEFVAHEILSSTASEAAVPGAEDKEVDLPKPQEESVKEQTTNGGAQLEEPVADEIRSKDLDVPTPVEEPAKDLTAEEVAQAESQEESLKQEAIDGGAESEEPAADETPSKDMDVPTAVEKPFQDLTSHEEAQAGKSVAENVPSTTASEAEVAGAEDKDVHVRTLQEESVKEETPERAQLEESAADDTPSPTASVAGVDGTEDVDLATQPAKEACPGEVAESQAFEGPDIKHVAQAEAPTIHGDQNKELSVPEDVDLTTESAATLHPVQDKTLDSHTAPEEALTTDSPEVTLAMEDKAVKAAPKPLQEVAEEDTATHESALTLETDGFSPLEESKGAEPVVGKDVEVPAPHEHLAQEDTLTRDIPLSPEDFVVTSLADNEDVETEICKEKLTQEKSSPDGVSSTTDSSEPVGAVVGNDEESPPPQKQLDAVTTETKEFTSTSEGQTVAAPVVEDKDVESTTKVKSSEEPTIADDVPFDTIGLAPEASALEVENHVEPATAREDLIVNSEAAPATKELADSVANATDLAAEPAEIVDKHVLTAEFPATESLKTVAATLETEPTGVEGNKEEKEILLAETPEAALDSDTLEKTVDKSYQVTTGDSGGAPLDSQEGHEAGNDLPPSGLTTTTSKATQARDFVPGLLQELHQEKVQNTEQQGPEEEDKATVPLSIHTADLSSSWVSVSPVLSGAAQSAASGSHLNMSQSSQTGRPEADLASSGGDDWRIVSEQDISVLGPSKSKEVDGGSSGAKFPFSIVLWCSQSMSTLFGGPQK